jgi:hypothetical protein
MNDHDLTQIFEDDWENQNIHREFKIWKKSCFRSVVVPTQKLFVTKYRLKMFVHHHVSIVCSGLTLCYPSLRTR